WHLAKLADDPGKVSLVYHGLDIRRFPPVSRRSHRNGSQPHDPVRLLSVGRAVEKKGFDVLIDALSGLPDGLYWRWTHIGAGADLEKLRAQAEALGVRKRIDWLGSRTQQEVIEHYRNADIFILPAREAADGDRDGLPNVLLEAQSQSLPCIATRFSAIPELILDGETGVLVESGSVAELRHAIHALIRDPLRRDRLGAAGDHHVRKRFSHLSGLTELAQRFGLGPRRNDGRSAA
ncbi:MAG: glycosyltransferase family 4 protein, partial [Hyphomicrobiales bacterium]